MDTLKLKAQIIDALNLEELKPEDINDEAPLFGPEGLGLDSIDALELIVLLEKNYGIKLTDPAKAKGVFASVATMASFIEENK
jgi:acyl carrier protein